MISCTPLLFCGDVVAEPRILQFVTEPGHVHRERVVVNVTVTLPQMFHDSVPGNNLSPVFHENMQNSIFVFCQVNLFPANGEGTVA